MFAKLNTLKTGLIVPILVAALILISTFLGFEFAPVSKFALTFSFLFFLLVISLKENLNQINNSSLAVYISLGIVSVISAGIYAFITTSAIIIAAVAGVSLIAVCLILAD